LDKRTEIRGHLIELFTQTDFSKETPEQLVDAILWVLNEDGVVIKTGFKIMDELGVELGDEVEPLIKEE